MSLRRPPGYYRATAGSWWQWKTRMRNQLASVTTGEYQVAVVRSSRLSAGEVEVISVVAADADRVWSEVIRFDGINAEFMPVMRMTSPRGWRDRSLEDVDPGQRLFRSWLLLFGVFPVDYDDIRLVEVGPGYRFLERSQMMSSSTWEHERVIEAVAPGTCRISDRVRFTPRWRLLGPVLRWFVPRLFAHRHRQLRRRYSGPA